MRKSGWLLSCLLLLLTSAGAKAQYGDSDLARDWDLRLGFFVPERSASRAAEGDIWWHFGAERRFFQKDRVEGTLSVDYYGSGNLYNVPILMNLRHTTGRLRVGVGIGPGISHDRNDGIVGFAYAVGAGYEVYQAEKPINFDIRYMGLSTGGGDLNGWAFSVGFRL